MYMPEDTSSEVHDHGSGDRWIWTFFLIVSYPEHKPPPETLKTLITKLEDYGIIKNPGWYPSA
jgi:hypothetical protein